MVPTTLLHTSCLLFGPDGVSVKTPSIIEHATFWLVHSTGCASCMFPHHTHDTGLSTVVVADTRKPATAACRSPPSG